ncbi:protein Wnt-9a-like [Diadema antillarum]|uniref:protein Wnt-9a-like n=1 Tax=Diadema antillarum TaxID=105358 RepID=UPI003A8A0FF4
MPRSYRWLLAVSAVSSLLHTIVFLLLINAPVTHGYFGLASSNRISLDRMGRDCKSLFLTKRQQKLCNRDSEMAAVLLDAFRLSLSECRSQFKHERWNCSMSSDAHRYNILKEGMKETAFLSAISSAGLVHAIAQGCSRGSLERCSCDEVSFSDEANREAWKWGGCGDNLSYSQRFLKDFLKGKSTGSRDLRSKMDRHNSNLGLRAVRRRVQKVCKCHGISGACTTQTCWKQLGLFHDVGGDIKQRYERAVQVILANRADGENELVRRRAARRGDAGREATASPGKGDLVYERASPDFCSPSIYSEGTGGRECDKVRTCDSLCCGRGYNIRSVMVTRACQCRFHWCCDVICQRCTTREEIHLCRV